MQASFAAPSARWGPLAMALIVLGLLALPVSAQAQRAHSREAVAIASAGWHGRAIQNPRPRPRLARTAWPQGWSAGPVGFGTGYLHAGGSDRVRELQSRLRQLGYRPGPADGLFGPRTRAATRWFQFKHGLPVTGRVTRATLTVLQARSDHRPLPTATQRRDTTPAQPEPTAVPPLQTPHAAPDAGENVAVTWLLAGLLMLLALTLGVIASLVVPALRRQPARAPSAPARPPLPAPVPAPARARPAVRAVDARVLGYAAVEADDEHADTATAALALRSAHRGWTLVEVVHDRPTLELGERPGLKYALDTMRSGRADGLVVARLSDFTRRVTDLATVLAWLDDAQAFLAAADHELDTSTRAGRGTAAAIIQLGHWERQLISARTREDLARRRFTPGGGPTAADLTDQITAMRRQGLSLRAISEALNLARMPTPQGRTAWHTTDVKAVAEARNRT
jgi:DNA invertase Pin-like site-specific DNA recombinase